MCDISLELVNYTLAVFTQHDMYLRCVDATDLLTLLYLFDQIRASLQPRSLGRVSVGVNRR